MCDDPKINLKQYETVPYDHYWVVHGSGKVEVCGLKNEKHSVISDLGFSQENHLSKGAFHLSELGGRTMAGPVSFESEIGFFQEFLLKNHFPRACYLGFDLSGWRVLVEREIIIATGMVWPVSSDKWKAP